MSWDELGRGILYVSSRGKKISYEADMRLNLLFGEKQLGESKSVEHAGFSNSCPTPRTSPPFGFLFVSWGMVPVTVGRWLSWLQSSQLLPLRWHEIDVRGRWPVWTRTTLEALECCTPPKHMFKFVRLSRQWQLLGAQALSIFPASVSSLHRKKQDSWSAYSLGIIIPTWHEQTGQQYSFFKNILKYSGPHVKHVTGSRHGV
jgi:hypothetical protein